MDAQMDRWSTDRSVDKHTHVHDISQTHPLAKNHLHDTTWITTWQLWGSEKLLQWMQRHEDWGRCFAMLCEIALLPGSSRWSERSYLKWSEMHWAMLAPQFWLLPCRRMTPLAQHNQNQQWLYDVNWCYILLYAICPSSRKPWQLQPYHLSNIGTHRIKQISRAKTQKCSQPLLLSCRPIPLRFDLIEVQQLGEEVMSPARHHGRIYSLLISTHLIQDLFAISTSRIFKTYWIIGWFQSHFFPLRGTALTKVIAK